jgi:hypothetical protein
MTTTNGSSVREQNYHRALQASPEIQALDTMVRLIALLGPPGGDKPMCHGCFWESALKPLSPDTIQCIFRSFAEKARARNFPAGR